MLNGDTFKKFNYESFQPKRFSYETFRYDPFYYCDLNGNKYDVANYEKVLHNGKTIPMTGEEINEILGPEKYKEYQSRKENKNNQEDSKTEKFGACIAGGLALILLAAVAITSNNKK